MKNYRQQTNFKKRMFRISIEINKGPESIKQEMKELKKRKRIADF